MAAKKNTDAKNTSKARAHDEKPGDAPAGSSPTRALSGPPSAPAPRGGRGRVDAQRSAVDEVVRSVPYNPNKASEYGTASRVASPGFTSPTESPEVTASTLTEDVSSVKVGAGAPALGRSPGTGSLDSSRADGSARRLTTNQGVPVADNQHSLKAGLRGPALLEDFILREKITHFDHERIPERIVHARGSAAHGYFECYAPQSAVTCASLFSEAGKRTPVFVRFSTVLGERGSADTVRDVRGFAVKFYTDEGNWDLVGNNMPVFFIQDAMKFPDLIHAAKPEPHFGMPQAASAHDTFWDFVSLMPESTHMLMWAMSDRALPRSYRMMQGFGVHTFRLVDAGGRSTFVKFHWRPVLGTHCLDWDEAVKIAGADPDFHRRDLWEAIEAGAFPEWELSFQLFSEEDAERYSFDVLDATKLVPEELVPLTPVGRMVLDRNPDNFFAETEQVAFCAAHVVRGIDFSNDPLLAGRIHSYSDTQISRLGGPNFHEIPINAPVAPVHNNQRDGMHQKAVHRGRVAYEPNSLGGGCPFQAGAAGGGFTSFREPISADKVRGKAERFADHFTQATLFWNSQTPIERAHILRGFRFELTKVQTPAIRERVVSMLANVDLGLAEALALELGMEMPAPMPSALETPVKPEVKDSPALSVFSQRGEKTIRTRQVAILVDDGVDGHAVRTIQSALLAEGAVVKVVGPRLGKMTSTGGERVDVDATFETNPSVLYDAVAIPGGKDMADRLASLGQVLEIVKDQYRHAKTLFVVADSRKLLEKASVPAALPSGEADPGIVLVDEVEDGLAAFVEAIARHRHFERVVDPPRV